VEKELPNGAFNAPALLQPDEARGRRTFLVKQHDYKGGMLLDGAVIGTEGTSPPGSRCVIWQWAVGWPPTHTFRHIE
jgi:hypothetical protein